MVRTIIKPTNKSVLIEVPEEFVGKEVEIIAFTIDEADTTDIPSGETLTLFASEHVLAKNWLSPEEDIAWQSL